MGLIGALLFTHPAEFLDRALILADSLRDTFVTRPSVYQPRDWRTATEQFGRCVAVAMEELSAEPALAEIEREVCDRIAHAQAAGPLPLSYNADITLARTCYLACRALKPAIVLETGVAYGMTSAFVLKALAINGHGQLHSIDMQPVGYDTEKFVGILIPGGLKTRWRLHWGASRRLLRALLPQLGQVGVFIHDSAHTYGNMRRELRMVTPYLAQRSAVIVDDVDRNKAFYEWAAAAQPSFWAVIPESGKDGFYGMSAFNRASAGIA